MFLPKPYDLPVGSMLLELSQWAMMFRSHAHFGPISCKEKFQLLPLFFHLCDDTSPPLKTAIFGLVICTFPVVGP